MARTKPKPKRPRKRSKAEARPKKRAPARKPVKRKRPVRAKAARGLEVALATRESLIAIPKAEPIDLSPLQLVETSPGQYSLLLAELSATSAVFAAAGVYGGGYAWEIVARHVIERDARHLDGRIAFDPEASMFCARSDERAALVELGTRLQRLARDHAALAQLIESSGGVEAFLD